jgi:hypothetical protein
MTKKATIETVAIETQFERFGQLIDRLDNLSHALEMTINPATHVQALRDSLPEIVREFKDVFTAISDVDAWEGER